MFLFNGIDPNEYSFFDQVNDKRCYRDCGHIDRCSLNFSPKTIIEMFIRRKIILNNSVNY